MNIPYKKQFNPDGTPIELKENYINEFPNRKQRRQHKNKPAFFGNGKNFPLTVNAMPPIKYKRVRQIEKDKDGNRKTIEHNLLQ